MEKISLTVLKKKLKDKGFEIKKSGNSWHLIDTKTKEELALHYFYNDADEITVITDVLNETLRSN